MMCWMDLRKGIERTFRDIFKEDIMQNDIKKLQDFIHSSNNIVFFGGAGVSTESGIPDFRSRDGLYNTQYKYPPETILSRSFFMSNTSEFYRFYRNKMVFTNAQPNLAHIALTKLEEQGKLKAIVTQNIDGLHSAAGSKNVIELHGSLHRNFCMDCKKTYSLETMLQADDIPLCSCGGIIRPDVVLYEEALDESVIQNAVSSISNSDMLIIGGTSLMVYPAAAFINYYNGDKLVLINMSSTPYDFKANLVIRNSIGEVLTGGILI